MQRARNKQRAGGGAPAPARTWNRYLMKMRLEEVVSSSVSMMHDSELQGSASVASRCANRHDTLRSLLVSSLRERAGVETWARETECVLRKQKGAALALAVCTDTCVCIYRAQGEVRRQYCNVRYTPHTRPQSLAAKARSHTCSTCSAPAPPKPPVPPPPLHAPVDDGVLLAEAVLELLGVGAVEVAEALRQQSVEALEGALLAAALDDHGHQLNFLRGGVWASRV